MDAAFDLRPAAPASRPGVLTGLNRARARKAADRGKALGNQRMAREPRLGDVTQHTARGPAGERIDLEPLALGLEHGQPRTSGCLKALPAGNPGVVALDRRGERTNLANVTAAVRVAHQEDLIRILD